MCQWIANERKDYENSYPRFAQTTSRCSTDGLVLYNRVLTEIIYLFQMGDECASHINVPCALQMVHPE